MGKLLGLLALLVVLALPVNSQLPSLNLKPLCAMPCSPASGQQEVTKTKINVAGLAEKIVCTMDPVMKECIKKNCDISGIPAVNKYYKDSQDCDLESMFSPSGGGRTCQTSQVIAVAVMLGVTLTLLLLQ